MKKRILSCLMALALCLTLLPTAALAEEPEGTAQMSPAVEEAADPANGKAKQENQPAEQEEQQEDSATKQDEDVAAVQAMIDALPDAAELDGMDDADAMAVYEAFQTACDAYYDTLTEGQQAQLKNTEKLAALSDWFSQPETLATGEHRNHCVCGKSGCTGHDVITFNKWLTSTEYKLDVGVGEGTSGTGQTPVDGKYVLPADKLSADNYYLRANITIDHPIQIKGNVTICLNGHTIESKAKDQPVFEVVSGGTLTLTDCGSAGKVTSAYNGGGVEVNGGEFNLYGGKITKNTATNGGGVKVTGGTVNMYGGEIADNKAAGSAEGTGNGGGVYVSGGTFNMRGGSITNNTTEVSAKGEGNGGGVYVHANGTFNLYDGGSITNNKANKYGGGNKGGGVYVGSYSQAGTFHMYGGKITNNTATQYGGGVYVYEGTFDMDEGEISGNTTSGPGGGVRVSRVNCTFTMRGGEIKDNTASSGGGVSVVDQGEFTMCGGSITNNKATGNGGGVSMNLVGKFTVSGKANITGNKKGTANNNVYLLDNKPIIIGVDGLADGASIGVTTESTQAGSVIATGTSLSDKDAEKFQSDLGGYAVSAKSDGTGLVLVKAHKHFLCGRDECNGNGHPCHAATFTAWTDSKKLPETKGEYYLDTDVTLSSTWTPASGTVLCLNGHSITANGSITAIYVNNAFTLCDCKGGKDAYGQITHTAGMTGSGVNVLSGGVFHMYGGSISGNTADNGGGVYMGGGQFTMYGGSITKNTATKNGGGVYVNSGCKFDMNGNASVSGNTTTTGNGGGVYVGGGTFTMNYSASVKDNTASGNTADQGNGGGVYVYSGTFEMNGSASVSSNKATNTDQRKTTYGGGVYVKSTNSTFTMNDKASITGNTAKNGGGVYASAGEFNMNSTASVTGNIGNGVCVSDRATFTVSDRPTVTGNTMNKADSNVYLNGGAYITIGAYGLKGSANSIGVTKTVDGGVIATGVNEDYSGKFFSDNTQYVVKYDNKQLVLAVPSAVTHTHSWQFTKETGNDSTIFVSCKGTPGSCDYKNTPATVKISTDQTVYDCAQITEAPKATLTYSANWPKDVVQAQENDIKYWRSNDGGTSYKVPVTDNNELKKPGKYLAQLKFNEKWLEAHFSVVDNGKQDPKYTPPTAKTGLVYNGTAQVLINEGHVEGCIMQYRLDNGGDYSDSLPTATNAGTYTVWYKVVGDDSHNNIVAEKSLKVWIEKAPLRGTPTFTKVTGAGKTLKDVTFTKAVGWPTGEFKWDNGAAGYDMNAPLVQGKAYSWLYLADNYYAKGTVVLWADPSSGGSSGGSSSGGGGGSSSPSNHPVKAEVSKDPDGSVSLSKTSAAKGDKVTITVKPERHYAVDKVIVRDSKGKQLAVKDNGDGTFTFEMPADKVTVEPSFSWVNPFADVADSAYYVDAVEWMLKREVTQGTTETTFSPDLNCTRAQIVTFLWRVAGSPAPKGTVSFADVSADSYYAKAVAWAEEYGIADGIGGGLFGPDATCTRAQSAVFLYRVAGSPAVNGSAGFSDVAADAYYAQAVAWAKEHGITDGIGGGLFGSANDCTRAQIAAFLYRYMK